MYNKNNISRKVKTPYNLERKEYEEQTPCQRQFSKATMQLACSMKYKKVSPSCYLDA